MERDIDLSLAFYHAVKDACCCLICGTKDQLTLHHVSPAYKLTEVIKFARVGDLDGLVGEFNKCVPICDRHHRQIHEGRIKNWMNGRNNKGKIDVASSARHYSPFLNWFAKEDPVTITRFYVQHFDKAARMGPIVPLLPNQIRTRLAPATLLEVPRMQIPQLKPPQHSSV